jgi:hypothetical protein
MCNTISLTLHTDGSIFISRSRNEITYFVILLIFTLT